jgi:hypothetical protein
VDARENTFPMDISASAPGRWKFRPTGYLVVVLAGHEEGQRAEAALVEGGFHPGDLKLYTGGQILDNFKAYQDERTIAGKILGTVADDLESRDLYLEYAREGRSALWVRIPNEDDVPKALRVLAGYDSVHARYYGIDKETDVHIG